MKRLSEAEFLATTTPRMDRTSGESARPFDFWPYFDAIPAPDFQGFNCSESEVSLVYRTSDGRYEHVLVNSEDKDVFMVLVLDLHVQRVVGHHLLNLPMLYDLRDSQAELNKPPHN